MKYYLAVDIGASSGRHIVGRMENGELKTDEVFRFPNGFVRKDGHLIWDLEKLSDYVKEGIDIAAEKYDISSLAIDTWGVDYVLFKDGQPILPAYAYRDRRTEKVIPEVHKTVPFEELYAHTGCMFFSFNSIYQLCDDRNTGRLEEADDLCMIPEYLSWKLTGRKLREYTNATTTGLVNAVTGQYDTGLLDRLGLPRRLFPRLVQPGTELGSYRGIKVILCATHDTASAVEGIPMKENMPYISSGTWSLMGIKTPAPLTDEASRKANFSNEGGPGYNRYQKNIMGMWVINELRRELCPEASFDSIVAGAESSDYAKTVDLREDRFLAPDSMAGAFEKALGEKPPQRMDYFRCAYRSLAVCYRKTLEEIEANTGKEYPEIWIVGGGAKNRYLNELTGEATGKRIVALPIEATALGNLKIQMEHDRP